MLLIRADNCSTASFTGFQQCNNITFQSGSFYGNPKGFNGFTHNLTVTDNGVGLAIANVKAFTSYIDMDNAFPTSGPPIEFKFVNPHTSQSFANGYFSVTSTGGDAATTDNIAAFTRAYVGGSANGIGYKGFASQNVTYTGASGKYRNLSL